MDVPCVQCIHVFTEVLHHTNVLYFTYIGGQIDRISTMVCMYATMAEMSPAKTLYHTVGDSAAVTVAVSAAVTVADIVGGTVAYSDGGNVGDSDGGIHPVFNIWCPKDAKDKLLEFSFFFLHRKCVINCVINYVINVLVHLIFE